MDTRLQKEILKMFINKDSIIEKNIIADLHQLYYIRETFPLSTFKIKHQLDLLVDDGSLVKQENISYRITEWGELRTKGFIKRNWYWLINKNHNLISFIALLASLVAISISLIK